MCVHVRMCISRCRQVCICTSACAGGAFVCACGGHRCVHMCVYWWVDGWVQKEFSILRVNMCTFCSEHRLPKCFIYVRNNLRMRLNGEEEPG